VGKKNSLDMAALLRFSKAFKRGDIEEEIIAKIKSLATAGDF
jgi:hypothetical protein